MCRLPFYVAVVCRSTDIFFLLVVEDKPIILMWKTFHILIHHEFRDIELDATQPKEILQSQLYLMLLHPQHIITMHKINHTIQPLPQLQITNIFS